MTKKQFRESTEYANLMKRIKGYRAGFEFTVNYTAVRAVSGAKLNGLRTLLEDACQNGLLESISIGYSIDDLLNDAITEERFRRTNK